MPEARLAELGLVLPPPPAPAGAYVPAITLGPAGLAVTAGMLPLVDGALPRKGRVGVEVTPEEARLDARQACLNALAALKAELGGLDRIARVVRVEGFVASAPDFTGQPGVVNGASELLLEIFGEAGRHTRFAVGAAVLPLDAPVELALWVSLKG